MAIAGADTAFTSYRWRWHVLAVVLVAEAMDILDTTVVNVAGPSVQRSIGGGIDLVQWVSAAYTLAFAVLLITGGRLGDRYGRRRMFLLGAAGFTAASVACGLAATPAMLIVARLAQGCFAAMLLPQGVGLITSTFSQREVSKAFSAYAPVLSLAAVIGPPLAGVLIGLNAWGMGWRLVFLVNLVLGGVAFVGGLRYLPPDGDAAVERLDLTGVFLMAVATFLTIYPLIQGREAGWPAWAFILLAAGIAALWLFARHERRSTAPLIEPTLLRRRTYLAGAAAALMFFGATAGIMLVLSLYAQYDLGYSALGAGIMLVPMAAGNAVGALVAMRLAPRLGGRLTIQANLGVAIIGLVSMAVGDAMTSRPDLLLLAGPIFVLGFGFGGTIAPLFSTILADVTPAEIGSASGSLGAVQQLAGSVGVAAVGTLYAASSEIARPGLAVSALGTAGALLVCAAVTLLLPPARSDPAAAEVTSSSGS